MSFNNLALYATYRDIHDALLSSKRRVSSDFLLEFLARRGYIFSPLSSRERLIEYVASLTLSEHDFQELSHQLETSLRSERVASTRLVSRSLEIDASKLNEIVSNIRLLRKDRNEVITAQQHDGKLVVNVKYQDYDHGKTILRQRRNRNVDIEIYRDGNGYTFRRPASPRMQEVCRELILQCQNLLPPASVKIERIDLSALGREHRTAFFRKLIDSVPGYSFHDLIKVGVSQPLSSVAYTDSSSNEPDDDDVDEDFSEKAQEVAAQVKSFLKRAALDGTGVLHSPELTRFLDSGFFIARVVWQAIETRSGGKKVEFEALIAKPSAGEDFRYDVKGVYPVKRDGLHALVRQKPKENDLGPLLGLLERGAKDAIRVVQEDIANGK